MNYNVVKNLNNYLKIFKEINNKVRFKFVLSLTTKYNTNAICYEINSHL